MRMKSINKRLLRKHLSRAERHFVYLVVALIFTLFVFGFSYRKEVAPNHSRKLLTGDCSSHPTSFEKSYHSLALVIYALAIIYSFIGIAIVCDDYFMGSLEKISDKLNLTEDVAGATFLAAAGSAPELFSNISDTFTYSNNIGVGTIVGSAMFNILIIIAASAVVAPEPLHIDWKPFARDVTFYVLSIVLVFIFFQDNKVWWWESLLFIFLYFCYIFYMAYAKKISLFFGKDDGMEKNIISEKTVEIVTLPSSESVEQDMHSSQKATTTDKENQEEQKKEIVEKDKKEKKKDEEENEENTEQSGFYACVIKFLECISKPLTFLFSVTIPPCEEEGWEKWYMVSFLVSIIWIAGFAMVMVLLASWSGCLLNVSPILLGVTVLAVGTSVPDALGSILAAREGKGGMACSNAIGSNVFDICLGLGIPWAVRCIFVEPWTYITVHGEVFFPVLILFITVLLVVIVFSLSKFILTKTLGLALVMMYIAYLIITVIHGV